MQNFLITNTLSFKDTSLMHSELILALSNPNNYFLNMLNCHQLFQQIDSAIFSIKCSFFQSQGQPIS